METIINYWYIIVALAAVVAAAGIAIYRHFKLPSKEQLENVRAWLLGAVTKAERDLGGGTGRLKLRQVYDLFVGRFPWVAKVLSFNTFSEMVDDALEEMEEMLKNNENVAAYVEGQVSNNGC